jgi:hypothetical protein
VTDTAELFSGDEWAECEIEHLKSLYGHVQNVEIALDLKRSIGAVGAKAHALGLNTRTNLNRRPEASPAAKRALQISLRRYFKAAAHDAI